MIFFCQLFWFTSSLKESTSRSAAAWSARASERVFTTSLCFSRNKFASSSAARVCSQAWAVDAVSCVSIGPKVGNQKRVGVLLEFHQAIHPLTERDACWDLQYTSNCMYIYIYICIYTYML